MQIHVLWFAGLIKGGENASQPSNVFRRNAPCTASVVEIFKTAVSKGLDHKFSLERRQSLVN